MDHQASRYLYIRSRVESLHGQYIRNEVGKFHHDIITLVDRVFVHLPAIFSKEAPLSFPNSDVKNQDAIPSTEWVAWYFYQKFYCDVELHADNAGYKVSKKKFLSTISKFTPSENRNNLFFIQGDIGCGKTAFINYLITTYGQKYYEKSDAWFLRINVDVTRHFDDRSLSSFFRVLCFKLNTTIVKIFNHHYNSSINQQTLDEINKIKIKLSKAEENSDEDESIVIFVDCMKKISKILGKKPILILDNLDYFFHENDRYLFISNVDTGEDLYISLIQKIVSAFYHGSSKAGDLGANILFVLRPDSYEILKASRELYQGVEDCFRDNKNLYTLRTPDWESVIVERGELIKRVISEVPKAGLKNSIRNSLSSVLLALENPNQINAIIDHLRHIVPFGLRSVMNFFKTYTWLNHNEKDGFVNPTTRYIEQYPVGLMSFMLNNQRCYSQKDSNFPNIFLTNIEADEEYIVNESVSSRTEQPHTLSSQHPPAYWLKRLLLEFLLKRNSVGEATTTTDIVNIFAQNEEGYYHESLVRLCMGSFAQTHTSNLIRIKRQLSSDKKRLVVEDIILTERATHCLNKIFDKFFYLQLIIDDYSMPLPKKCREHFLYNSEIHYGYLVLDGDTYHSKAKKMVERKAILVTKLLAILEIALECEKEKYHHVFQVLQLEGVNLPNIAKIKRNVFKELRSLQKYKNSPATNVNIERLESLFNRYKSRLRKEIRLSYGLD